MDWIDFKLRNPWILLGVSWSIGFLFFLARHDTREESKKYWQQLKHVAFLTMCAVVMGGLLMILGVGPVLAVVQWVKRFTH
jgi:hypothetical protein